MRSIFIGSTGSEPGQTLAAWALAVKLKAKGARLGFFKPYGLFPDGRVSADGVFCDPDVTLFKTVLGLTEADETLCPVVLTENLLAEVSGSHEEQLIQKIEQAHGEISRSKDVVLIMGAKEIFLGSGLSKLSDSLLVKLFDASVLLVDRYQRENLTLYSLLSLNSFLDGRVKTAILNHVPPEKMDPLQTKVIPFLRSKGLKSVVAVPESPILAAWTVFTIADLIEGQILCCSDLGGHLIQTFTIGAKHLEGPLAIFKQVYNKILLMALPETGEGEKTVGGIILTGGKIPGDLVLRIAQERSIPLILTRADTFQTMERLEKAKPSLRARDEFKVLRFLALMDQAAGSDEWVEALL